MENPLTISLISKMIHGGKVKGTDLVHCGTEKDEICSLDLPIICIILEISDMVYSHKDSRQQVCENPIHMSMEEEEDLKVLTMFLCKNQHGFSQDAANFYYLPSSIRRRQVSRRFVLEIRMQQICERMDLILVHRFITVPADSQDRLYGSGIS